MARVILPGVGSFGAFMRALTDNGFVDALRAATLTKPVLGICVGHQVMAELGTEGGTPDGLGLINARCVGLRALGVAKRVPQIGWRVIEARDSKELPPFFSVIRGRSAFFCHSYALDSAPQSSVVEVDYGVRVIAGFTSGNVTGVQFHPEKSQRVGQDFFAAWLRATE